MPIDQQGLSQKEVEQRRETFGSNTIAVDIKFSAVKLFLSQFPTFLNLILVLAMVGSLVIGDTLDAIFISVTFFLNAIIGFVQEYKAEKSLEKLKAFVTSSSRVLRDGKEIPIDSSELVPGDVVILSEGDRIPADGKILQTHHIEIDESVLTGESFAVVKRTGDPVFSGTLITKGNMHIEVTTIGLSTKFGSIAQTLATIKADRTPLQKNLTFIGKIISLIAIVISLLIFFLGVLRHEPLFPIILLATSAGIAAIPEGLPAIVTIALAIGTNRMAKKKAIVRKMPVVETLGSVQIILLDKTGTITQNSMRVKQLWTAEKEHETDILKASLLGNTASLAKKADGAFDVLGDKTDGALLLFATEKGIDKTSIIKDLTIVEEYSFDPETKTITTIVKNHTSLISFVRGAPEMLLEKSMASDTQKKLIETNIARFAKEGLRVIGFAKKIENKEHKLSREHAESHLTFLGLIGIYDPPRKEAKGAIEKATKAGIRTIMVTGDNELTALTIAKEINMIAENEDVFTTDEMAKLTDEQLYPAIMKTRIFARATPEDKLRLVSVLKKNNVIVAITGDGVNDALALKRSDVGVAMGASGTDVAKEASDIVITDDNFATLITAIEEGRTIYKNILAATTYLLIGNLSEISFIFFAALLGVTPPFHPTQILWINIITDGLPALALAADVKGSDILLEKPRDPKTPFLQKNTIMLICIFGIGIGLSLIITYVLLLKSSPAYLARTIIFHMLLAIHVLIVFAVRNKSPFVMSKFLVFSLVGSILIQILVMYLPIFHTIFELHP